MDRPQKPWNAPTEAHEWLVAIVLLVLVTLIAWGLR